MAQTTNPHVEEGSAWPARATFGKTVGLFTMIFVLTLVVVPIIAMAIDACLTGTGLILYTLILFPGYVFGGNGLYTGADFYDSTAFRLAMLAPWPVAAVAFGRTARNLRLWQQALAAIALIAAVILLRDTALAAFGWHVYLEAL